MASITGDLTTSGVPDLFRAIADGKRTGRLSLVRAEDDISQESHVYFRKGEAYHARLVGSGVQLGTRIVSAGLANKQEIEEALWTQKGEGGARRLGEILVEQGTVPIERLEAIVREQIEDTIFEILRWEGGAFTFETDVSSNEDVGIEVSAENLLMEGARRFREWHQISRRVPTLDAVPVFSSDSESAVEVALTPEEWAFVSALDGTLTVGQLASACGFTELEAARTVFGLVTAGLLEVELPPGVDFPEDDPEIEEVFDQLERAFEEQAGEQQRKQVRLEDLAGVASSGNGAAAASSAIETDEAGPGAEGEIEEAQPLEAEAKLEAERAEAERAEAERAEAERAEAERAEAERLEAERLEAERLEAERLEAERLEAERLEAERLEAERLEAERLEAERLEAERKGTDRAEAKRLKAEAKRMKAEAKLEEKRLADERVEAERLEAERAKLEAERLEAERLEAERLEAEKAKLEAERLEAEKAKLEAERLEAEKAKLEAERAEAERLEAEAPTPPTIESQSEEPAVASPIKVHDAWGVVDAAPKKEDLLQPITVLSEEMIEPRASSVARIFAELASPLDEPDVKPAPVEPEDSEDEETPEPVATNGDAAQFRRSFARPIDPDVDTSSFIRELAAFAVDEETKPEGVSEVLAKSSRRESADKGKGLFGRKRR